MSAKRVPREVPLRVAVVGPASAGKTALCEVLAARTGAALLKEGMRHDLEARAAGPLDTWGADAARELLLGLHAARLADERRMDSFVADTSCVDPVATGLHLGLFGDDERDLLREAQQGAAAYDAVFVLPHGVLPYVRDGVRPADELGQLAYAYLLDGLLGAEAACKRVIRMPRTLTGCEERAIFVIERLTAMGLQPQPALDRRVGTRFPLARCREGRVFLVGAGPGAPDLLTQRAAALIASADVIAHDRLVPPALLALAPERAELLAVGHRARGSKQVQYRIHPAVIERAQQGLRVVRLKAGDPLIFGRGGEEAEALNEAGVAFEIVPGVSAALGAAAAAGIPLTHRDYASDVTFATGHDLSSGRENRANFAAMAQGRGTLVLYMATRRLGENLARLVSLGRPGNTPAAYVAAATRHEQVVVTGTLADLWQRCADIDRSMPALVIVGDVVSCRARIAWRERRRLTGRRFLLGRGRPGPSALAEELRELGASVVEEPVVKARALVPPGALDACLLGLEASSAGCGPDSSVVVLASAEAVHRLVARWHERERALVEFPTVPLLALGPETAAALNAHGLKAAQTSPGHCIDGLRSLKLPAHVHIWVLDSDCGRPSLMEDMAQLNWRASYVPTYELERRPSGIDPGVLDAGLFTASSSVRELTTGGGVLAQRLHGVPAFAIGPKTRRALEQCRGGDEGKEIVMMERDSREDLAQVLVARFGRTSVELQVAGGESS